MKKESKKAPVAPDMFNNMFEFFNEYLAPIYTQKIDRSSAYWEPDWTQNIEAVTRLSAVWVSFETYNKAKNVAAWFLQVADPMMSRLMSNIGPFAKSKYEKQHGLPLPKVKLPDDDASSNAQNDDSNDAPSDTTAQETDSIKVDFDPAEDDYL